MRKGFTLVELSVVLVIIGLLIGGILVAQSMIATARIQNFIRITQQFDVAVNNFQTQYNSLPGDSLEFDVPGNEDNKILESGGYGACNCFTDEIANFWVHLQEGGFNYPNKTFNATISTAHFDIDSSTPNSPKLWADFANGAGIIVHYSYFFQNNAYSIASWANSYGATPNIAGDSDPVFKPATALAIDQKIDDGKPYTGNIRNVVGEGNDGEFKNSHCTNYSTTNNYNTAVYNASYKSVACYAGIKMLIQAGM